MKQNTLYRLLSNRVRKNGSRLFLQKKDGWSWKQLTWLDFDVEIKNIASFLVDLGFTKGDKILIVSPNHLKCHILKCAVLAIGGIIVPVSEYEFERNWEVISHMEDIRFVAIDSKDVLDFALLRKNVISNIIIFSQGTGFDRADRVVNYDSVVKFGFLKRKRLVDQLEESMSSVLPSDPAVKILGFDDDPRKKIITQEMLLSLLSIASRKLRFLSTEDQFYTFLSNSGSYSNLVSLLPLFLEIRGAMAEEISEFFQDIKEIMPTVLFIDREILTERVGEVIKKSSSIENIRDFLGKRLRYLVVDKSPDSFLTSSFVGSGISIIELTEFSALGV